MTVKEYLDLNQMTQTEFARQIGVTIVTVNKHLKLGTKFRDKKTVSKMRALGIDVELHQAIGKQALSEFIYQEKLHIEEHPIGEIYCYSLERVNEVTQYLNRRKISYYMRSIHDYWMVKYDTTLRSDEV